MTDIETGLQRVENELKILTGLCLDLAGVLEKEKEALSRGRTEDITPHVRLKQDILRRIAAAEEERRAAAADMARFLGMNVEDVTLSRLAENLDADRAARLSKGKDSLLDAMKGICVLNQGNAQLLRHALYYNRRLLNLLTGAEGRTYDSGGGEKSVPARVLEKQI